MEKLFIDANIYLRFYDNSQPEYKKLLKTLVEVKDSIIVTQQIVDEVNRNKLNVFHLSCTDTLSVEPLKQRRLPEHFDSEERDDIKAWNVDRERLVEKSCALKKRQSEIFEKVHSEISRSEDEVSKSLESVFEARLTPSIEELSRAKSRKERGNPPGKAQDPIGDQVSWEQLLTQIGNVTHLWIVSNDADYFTIYNGKCYLNPVLSSEVYSASGGRFEIDCFSKLADGLKSFNAHLALKLTTIPKEAELEAISKSESVPFPVTPPSGSLPPYGTSGSQDVVVTAGQLLGCPNCQSFSVSGPVITHGQGGSMMFTYVCRACGHQWRQLSFS